MRETADLVSEMNREEKTAWRVAIVVGFPSGTKFVSSSNKHPLETLNPFVQNGGFPPGLLRF